MPGISSYSTRKPFDVGLDGVPESVSGGVSIDVLTVKFTSCRSVYTLAVLRPRRTGLQIPDSVIMESFFKEYSDLREGRIRGVNSAELRYFICDAPKRAKLLNQKSHAGYSSCQHCHVRGERGRRGVCFPPESEGDLSNPRTLATVEAAADEAERTGVADVLGIKGSSVLRQIPGYDYVRGIAQERMHLCDLGLCRLLCRLMFRCRGALHPSDYSRLAGETFELDQEMRSVKVPAEFSRCTREFNYAVWKSEEFRNLYLAYWPVVAAVLRPVGRDLWLNFVFIMRGLIVREEDFITDARVRAWHRKFARVFGRDASTYNPHAFTHIVKLRSLGLLTDTSAVYNENHYGEMKKRFQSGTPSIGLQGIQDCNVRNLGTHVCRRSVKISAKTSVKRDDTLVFTRHGELVKVQRVMDGGVYEGRVIPREDTNFPIADLDFTQVHCYRLPRNWQQALGRRVTFSYSDVTGKGVVAKQYVSHIPLDVLQER